MVAEVGVETQHSGDAMVTGQWQVWNGAYQTSYMRCRWKNQRNGAAQVPWSPEDHEEVPDTGQ